MSILDLLNHFQLLRGHNVEMYPFFHFKPFSILQFAITNYSVMTIWDTFPESITKSEGVLI